MGECTPIELDAIEKYKANSSIFAGIKFYISGTVNDKILGILAEGGAEKLNYFSDYVTHCITGRDPNESDLLDAKDLYQVPAITQTWVLQSLKCKKLLPPPGFSPENRVFSGIVACLSTLSKEDAQRCWAMIHWHGGSCQLHFDKTCTHLITALPAGAKYACALQRADSVRIVTPDWVTDSVLTHRINEEALYHPRLLILPKPKQPALSLSQLEGSLTSLSTAQILGFDDEEDDAMAQPAAPVAQSRPLVQPSTAPDHSSKLEQLRQRMPWNKPAPTAVPQQQQLQLQEQLQQFQSVQQLQQQQRLSGMQPSQGQPHSPMPPGAGLLGQNQQGQAGILGQQVLQGQPGVQGQLGLQGQVSQGLSSIQGQQSLQGQPGIQGSPGIGQQALQGQLGIQGQQIMQGKPLGILQQPNQARAVRPQQLQAQLALQQAQAQGQAWRQNPPTLQQQQQLQLQKQQMQLQQLREQPQQQPQQQPQPVGTQQQPQYSLTLQREATQQQLPWQQQQYQLQQRQQQIQNQLQQLQQLQLQQQNTGQQNPQIPLQIIQQQQQLQQQLQQIQQGLLQIQQHQQQQNAQLQQQQQQQQPSQQQTSPQQLQQQNAPIQQQQQNPQLQQRQPQISWGPQAQVAGQPPIRQLIHLDPQTHARLQQMDPQQRAMFIQKIQKQRQFIMQRHMQQQQLQQQQQRAQQPGVPMQQQPGIPMQQQPGVPIQQQPGVPIQQQPGIPMQQQPGGPMQQQPGISMQQQPGGPMQQQPGVPMQQQPGIPMQQQPGGPMQQQIGIAMQPQQIVQQQQQQQQQQIVIRSQVPAGLSQQQQLVWMQQQRQRQQQQLALNPQIRQQVLVQQQPVRQQMAGPGQQLVNPGQQMVNPGQQIINSGQPGQQLVNANQQMVNPGQQLIGSGQQLVNSGQQLNQPGLVQVQQAGQQSQGAWLPQADSNQGQQSPSATQQQQQLAMHQLQRQQMQRLQQLQMQQREAAQKQQAAAGGAQRAPQASAQKPAQYATQAAPSTPLTPNMEELSAAAGDQPGLVVNPKTKTALANMLNTRLQGCATPQQLVGQGLVQQEGSAAGQLRLMTAAHHAQQHQPPPGVLATNIRPPQPPTDPAKLLAFQQQQQRRTLGNITNGAPVRAPNVVANANVIPTTVAAAAQLQQQPSTPNKSSVSRQLSESKNFPIHEQGPREQFYGHNPKLKLPPELCFLGCVFLIVDYPMSLPQEIPTWTKLIVGKGGEVETQYTPRVTHVVCETLASSVVKQALQEGKRCVSAYWLNDVVLKRQLLPPWMALHFPLPYGADKPCKQYLVACTGFEGQDRDRVKAMIQLTGARYTGSLSKHNRLLVARTPNDNKYTMARRNKMAVVNVQWLNEVLFGHTSCLQHTDAEKYQSYNVGNPFRIEYAQVLHLMVAWKMPINITQESHEKMKALSSAPPAKRARVSDTGLPPITEQENVPDNVNVINKEPRATPPIVMFSYCKNVDLNKKLAELGGISTKEFHEATHLVMSCPKPSFKLLCCISTVHHIVSEEWIIESHREKVFLDEQIYQFTETLVQDIGSYNVSKTLSSPNRRELFKGITLYLTPSVKPSPSYLQRAVEIVGGRVVKQFISIKQYNKVVKTEPQSYVVSCHEDIHLVEDFIKADVPIFTVDSVVCSILMQKMLLKSEATYINTLLD